MAKKINFIPNDPRASSKAPPLRAQLPRKNRKTGTASFKFTGSSPQGQYDPGTPEFLYWQCREAALASLDAWEAAVGPFKKWQGNRSRINLEQDAGEDLNAFYDRSSLSFFHYGIGSRRYFSGASTDVVSHEAGHALLDAVRPDFWDVSFLEVGAFHEAFGDVLAIMTALEDDATRTQLLAVTKTLRKKNFAETTAEDLSEGIRRLVPGHNAAEPRHAFNKLQYQLPQSLPDDGGPGELINEVHSFGMIFTGCFWSLLTNLFNAATSQTSSSLLAAARETLRLVVAGVKAAPITPRFLQAVGRAMVLADDTNGGKQRDYIRGAFQAHSIALGSGTLVAPSMALAGSAPRGATLSPSTRKDLEARLVLPKGSKLELSRADLFGSRVVQATHARRVDLGGVHKNLNGVIAIAPEPVIVGASGTRAAIVGSLPNVSDTETEVQSFVHTLVKHDRVSFRNSRGVVASKSRIGRPTHAVVSEGGEKVLRRVSFQCR